ncbi:MAG: peptidoglycan-associated lipoprotein Pal [Proteobacteria bacterium]|nr:peptidoglycan-associated lipoprotein Pal [Pseudomonadota bacterium]MDA1022312.1 peptidoglycan-associated lipoprotein Pal [Pseudomonadota bacterium]
MRYKILGLFAAVALVSACETGADSGGSAAGGAKPVESYTSPIIKSGSQKDLVVNVGDRVFFDFDKFNVDAAARKALEKQAAWLKANKSVTVVVQGHADERGTREYNLALGERRANSVKDYLVVLGVNSARVSTISYGKERPVATGSNEAAWKQNRRGVTKVTGAGS